MMCNLCRKCSGIFVQLTNVQKMCARIMEVQQFAIAATRYSPGGAMSMSGSGEG